jgi:hypothetical protein
MSRTLTQGSIIERIKAAFPLVDEFQADGHGLRRCGQRFKCLCPFHEERKASCVITPALGLFHCFGCGAGGTVIDYHALKRGISVKDAIRELRNRVGGIEQPPSRKLMRSPRKQKPEQLTPLNLDDLKRGTKDDICRLARLRSLSREGLTVAQNEGVLRFATLCGQRAWIITDSVHVVAQARRLDGGRWEHLDDAPKAWTLRGGRASWPVNVLKVPDRPKAVLLEGGADLLLAYHHPGRDARGFEFFACRRPSAFSRAASSYLSPH